MLKALPGVEPENPARRIAYRLAESSHLPLHPYMCKHIYLEYIYNIETKCVVPTFRERPLAAIVVSFYSDATCLCLIDVFLSSTDCACFQHYLKMESPAALVTVTRSLALNACATLVYPLNAVCELCGKHMVILTYVYMAYINQKKRICKLMRKVPVSGWFAP